MQRLQANLWWSRALASVSLANLLCLVLLNSLALPPRWTLLFFPAGIALGMWLLQPAYVRRAPIQAPGSTAVWSLCLLALLTLPRVPYLLEWIPGNSVLAWADDYGRLAELVSMTLSDRYPIRHPSSSSFLLSHYYTALFPMAFLKFAVPLLTLKDCIFAGNLLYHTLFAFSIPEVVARYVNRKTGYWVLLFLFTFFGGFDWIFYAGVLFSHSEQWPRKVFGSLREISGFYTGMFWVIHHFTAFYSVLLAGIFAGSLRFGGKWRKPLALSLLLISGIYSSLFATVTMCLLAPGSLIRLLKRTWTTRLFVPLILVFSAPVFLYTNRIQSGSFMWNPVRLNVFSAKTLDAAAGSISYLILASVVDLAFIPLLLFFVRRRFTPGELWMYRASMLFFVSTAVIESIGYNNYSMRGMFLPTVVFFVLAARHLVPRFLTSKPLRLAAVILACVSVLTTLKETAHLLYLPLMYSSWYWQVRGRPMPAEVAAQLRPEYATLARDASVHVYTPDERDRTGMAKFNAEKFVEIAPGDMTDAEYELLRRHRANWFW